MFDDEGRNEARGGNFGRRRMLQLSGVTTFGTLFVGSAAGEEDDEVETEASHQVSVSGPSNVEVGGSYQYQAGGYEGSGDYAYYWDSSGTISGDGKTVTVTFDSEGMHTVSVTVADVDRGELLGGDEMDVEAGDEPTPVEVNLYGRNELIVDQEAEITASPDIDNVAIDYDWNVEGADPAEYAISEDGETVSVTFYNEGELTLHVDYETEAGYESEASMDIEVFDLSRDRQNKVALANEVERLAVNLEEDGLTETLDNIIARAESGAVSPSTAREAIYRMQLAEDLTETTLAGMGPRTARSREDAKSRENGLVGEPRDSIVTQSQYNHPLPGMSADVNLTGETISSAVWTVVGLFAGAKAISKLVSRVSTAALSKAEELMLDNMDAILSLFPSNITIGGMIADVVNDFFDFIESEEEDDAVVLVNYLDEPIKYIRDWISEAWQGEFETGGIVNSDLEDHLEEINEEMSGGGSGGINLQGTQEGAEAAAETGGERMIDRIEGGIRGLAFLDLVSTVGDVLSVAAVFALAGGWVVAPIALAVAVFGTFLTVAGEFLSTMNGSIQLWSLREIHERSINGIIAGADWR